MVQPTRRGVLLAIAGFVVSLLPVIIDARLWTFWPIYLAWLILAFGLDMVLAPKRDGVTCELVHPEVLYVGTTDRASLQIRAPARWSVPVEVVVDLSEELAPLQRMSGFAGPTAARLELGLHPRRRGTARIETVWVRYRGPFGLMMITKKVPMGREMDVLPDILPVRSAALRFFSDREFRSGLKIERFRGEGTEFDSLKEFVDGDDRRTIHWKSSARHNKLVGRLFRAERNHQIVLAMDTGHLMAEPLAGIPKLDHALNAALLLSWVGLRSGDRVGLFTFDARVGIYLAPQAGMRTHQAMTRMTSRVAYSDAETNFTLGLTTLTQRVRRRSLIIVMTDFVDTVTAELMLENLDRLSRRHLVVFVALRDPELAALAARRPVDSVALNRAVVAQAFLRERETVLTRLRRMGISPIDAPPERIGTDLINSYLEIKRRELI